MNRLKMFTVDELYVLKRAFCESGFKFFMGDKYEPEQKQVHTALSNEVIDEIRNRRSGAGEVV